MNMMNHFIIFQGVRKGQLRSYMYMYKKNFYRMGKSRGQKLTDEPWDKNIIIIIKQALSMVSMLD